MPPKRKSKAKVKINNKLENKNVIIINQVDKRRPRRRRVSKPKAEEQQPKPLMPPVITQMPSYAGSASFNSRTYQPELTKPQAPVSNIQLKTKPSTMTLDTRDTIQEFLQKEQQVSQPPQTPKVTQRQTAIMTPFVSEEIATPAQAPKRPVQPPAPIKPKATNETDELRQRAYELFEDVKGNRNIYKSNVKDPEKRKLFVPPDFSKQNKNQIQEWMNNINAKLAQYEKVADLPIPQQQETTQTPIRSASQIMIDRPTPANPFTRKDFADEVEDDDEDMLS